MLTRQQLYELYYQGPRPTLDYIEALLAQLADFERIYGQQQQRIIAAQRQYNEKLTQQLKRAKEKLWHQESLNYQLKRRARRVGSGGGRQRFAQLFFAAVNGRAGGEGGELYQAHAEFAPAIGSASGRSTRASGPHQSCE